VDYENREEVGERWVMGRARGNEGRGVNNNVKKVRWYYPAV
jgi:hypothetical protein